MPTILGLEREVNLHLSRHYDECGDCFDSHCRAAVELQRYLNQAIRYLNDPYPTEKINTIRLNCRLWISETAFINISLTPTLLIGTEDFTLRENPWPLVRNSSQLPMLWGLKYDLYQDDCKPAEAHQNII